MARRATNLAAADSISSPYERGDAAVSKEDQSWALTWAATDG
jgi:hypothetical protein